MLGAAALLFGCERPEPPAAAAGRGEFRLPVQAAEVQPRDLSRSIRVSAPVEPLRTIRLATSIEGIVREVLVEEGDRVEAGEVVVRLDVAEQRAELARARNWKSPPAMWSCGRRVSASAP